MRALRQEWFDDELQDDIPKPRLDNRKPGHLFLEIHDQYFAPGGEGGYAYHSTLHGHGGALKKAIGWLRKNPGHSGKLGRVPRDRWDDLWRDVPKGTSKRYQRQLAKAGFITRVRTHDGAFIDLSHWETAVERAHLEKTKAARNARDRESYAQKRDQFDPETPSKPADTAHTERISEIRRHLTYAQAKRGALESECDQHALVVKDDNFLNREAVAEGRQAGDDGKDQAQGNVHRSRDDEEPTGSEASTMVRLFEAQIAHMHQVRAQNGIGQSQPNEPASQSHGEKRIENKPSEPAPKQELTRSQAPVSEDTLQALLAPYMNLKDLNTFIFLDAALSHEAVIQAFEGMHAKLKAKRVTNPAGMLFHGACCYQERSWNQRN